MGTIHRSMCFCYLQLFALSAYPIGAQPLFEDVTDEVFGDVAPFPFNGATFADYDNDGWPDLFVHIYINNG